MYGTISTHIFFERKYLFSIHPPVRYSTSNFWPESSFSSELKLLQFDSDLFETLRYKLFETETLIQEAKDFYLFRGDASKWNHSTGCRQMCVLSPTKALHMYINRYLVQRFGSLWHDFQKTPPSRMQQTLPYGGVVDVKIERPPQRLPCKIAYQETEPVAVFPNQNTQNYGIIGMPPNVAALSRTIVAS